jgi:hypothetical protein
VSCPDIGCQINEMITYFRSIEWTRELFFVTV